MHFPGAFPPRRPSRHLTAAGSQVRDKTSASPKMASVQFFRPWRSGIRMFLSDEEPTELDVRTPPLSPPPAPVFCKAAEPPPPDLPLPPVLTGHVSSLLPY
jgi:hypothetical protein